MGNDGAAWAALPTRLRWLTGAAVVAAAVRLAFGTTPAASIPTMAWFFGLLLVSSISATFKVRLPLSGGGSTMSLSYAVDFAALLLVGPDLACVAAALSTWSQTTFRVRRRNAPHQVLFSMAAVVLATAAAGQAYVGLGGALDAPPLTYALAVAGAAGVLLRGHDVARGVRRGLVARRLAALGVARGLPVDRARLRRRRRGRGRLRVGPRPRQRDRAADGGGGAGAADLSQLPRLLRAAGRRAAAGARGVRPAPGDRRGAGRRHRRQGQRLHPARAPRRAAGRPARPGARA